MRSQFTIPHLLMLPALGFLLSPPLYSGELDKISVPDNASLSQDSLSPYADFRFRYESDWDSSNGAGVLRSDRDRLRVRARVGIKYEPNDTWLFDLRARTGDSLSQQSPHLTIHDFDGGPNNDFSGILDKYYARIATDDFNLWMGRNAFPFWKQNELFWDDDVTITGAALSSKTEWLQGTLAGTIGAFYLPDGGWDLNGNMYAGQAVFTRKIGDYEITAAEGLYFIDGSPGAKQLLNGNGARDYTILGSQIAVARTLFDVPVSLGADVYFNLENYAANSPDRFTARNVDEDYGYVLSATLGSLKEKGDLQFGYYYAWLETFSVNASYAQDDWVRWGSATQTDSSDLKGHEFRLTYRAIKNLDIMARLYAVDAITSQQDGMRFRIDFNYSF